MLLAAQVLFLFHVDVFLSALRQRYPLIFSISGFNLLTLDLISLKNSCVIFLPPYCKN